MSISTLSEVAGVVGFIVFMVYLAAKIYDGFGSSEVREFIKNLLNQEGKNGADKVYLRAVEVILEGTILGGGSYKKVMIKMNRSLVASMLIVVEQAVKSVGNEKKAKTIVGMMLGEKIKRSSLAQIFLILSIVFHLALVAFFDANLSGLVLLLCGTALIAMHIDHKLIEYRVEMGWYGKNEFESREIIEFILSYSNKDDFNDHGGLKEIIPTPEVPDKEVSPANPVGALV